jgi:hypothetical protein
MRQMPPSFAWTMRSNPGQAEGRTEVAVGWTCFTQVTMVGVAVTRFP